MPNNVSVQQFWALIIHDFATGALIYKPLERVPLSGYDRPTMKAKFNGGADFYFGPTAPTGLESIWIPTQGKRPTPVMRFYGGTEEFWNKSLKLPDVELVKRCKQAVLPTSDQMAASRP